MKKKITQLKKWLNRFTADAISRHTKEDFAFALLPTIAIIIDEAEIELQVHWFTCSAGIIFNKHKVS